MKESNKTPPAAHLFICCRTREGKPACGNRDSLTLMENLKSWVKKNELKGRVKVSSSSCLGHCEEGIAACLYPENRWLTELTLADQEKLQQILLNTQKF